MREDQRGAEPQRAARHGGARTRRFAGLGEVAQQCVDAGVERTSSPEAPAISAPQLVAELARQGADVHALTRHPGKADFPAGVTAVKGDLLDVGSLRTALAPVSTLFLLNSASPDEVTQALLTLNLAHQARVERIVYLSVLHSGRFVDVPHFAGKYVVEHMIERLDLPATVLRPTYFINNDGS